MFNLQSLNSRGGTWGESGYDRGLMNRDFQDQRDDPSANQTGLRRMVAALKARIEALRTPRTLSAPGEGIAPDFSEAREIHPLRAAKTEGDLIAIIDLHYGVAVQEGDRVSLTLRKLNGSPVTLSGVVHPRERKITFQLPDVEDSGEGRSLDLEFHILWNRSGAESMPESIMLLNREEVIIDAEKGIRLLTSTSFIFNDLKPLR